MLLPFINLIVIIYSSDTKAKKVDFMNEICEIFKNAESNKVIVLEKNKVYNIFQDNCFEFKGYYCSNTARHNENPSGLRRTALYLKDKNDIEIDGNGATILVHGKMTPFLFDNCENITVKNLIVDYACPTMTEFTVLSNNNGICQIKINDDCLYEVKNKELIFHGETGTDGKPYWKDSYNGKKRHIKILLPETKLFADFSRADMEFSSIEDIGNNTLRVELKNKNVHFPAGGVIQSRNIIRDHTGSLFQRCKNLCFENLRIKFMHGLGMVSQFCENVTFKNCDFTPADGRTAASTADFFQFSGCKGQITIDGIKAGGAHDDFINVHGTHLQIIRRNKRKNTITVRFKHHESWGFQAFKKGDNIEFIKWDTLIPYANATVLNYKRLNVTDIRLYLDRVLPDNIVIGKDVVENATWTPDLHVKNCDFGLSCGRGILCTTRGKVVIENNSFKNIWGPALLLEDDCNFWFESGYTTEVIFRNNLLECCNYRKMYENAPVILYSPKVMDEKSTEFVHGKLVVEGNTFKHPIEDKHRIILSYLGEAQIKNNTFHEPYEINTKVVGDVVDENNIILNNP